MIKFNCRCSNTFTVDDDQAGASLQCPKCGLLVDVPTLSDLPNLSSDGTYNMTEVEERDEPERLNTLYRSFTRDHVDPATGLTIDLRHAPDDDDHQSRIIDPMQLKDDPKKLRPKYDPVTGEIVKEFPVEGADRPNPGAIPMAKASVNYASRVVKTVPGAMTVAVDLLSPVNVAVMAFVSVAYLAGHFFLIVFVFLFLVNVPISAFLLAHYANVIEDTGPELKDELPRPLRHLDLGEDLWRPFWRMFFTLLICYAPAVWILMQHLPWQISVVVAAVGSLAVPAVMLTATTSGSVANLRPDRVFGVIGVMGARYFVAVGLWVVALLLHLWTWIGTVIVRELITAGILDTKLSILVRPVAVYPLVAVAIYLMHYYCWYMGIQYRRHQHEFPWVFQHHIPDPARTSVRTRTMPYGQVSGGPSAGRRQFAPHA